jgi:hypothetical protein
VGAFFVNGAKSWFTVAFPEFWLFFLGALFIAVTLFLPRGVVALFDRLRPAQRAAVPSTPAPTSSSAPAPAANAASVAGTTGGRG